MFAVSLVDRRPEFTHKGKATRSWQRFVTPDERHIRGGDLERSSRPARDTPCRFVRTKTATPAIEAWGRHYME
jgi:hypothetical protein